MAAVADYKKDIVKQCVKLLKEYPIIGAVNMENLPAAQLQKMRTQLRGRVHLFMTKRRLMKIAIENVKAEKKGIEKLEESLKGMPALLFTKDNPFALYKILKKNKSSAPAKAGQTAPKDLIVPAGPTPFAPGPIIGELGALGIKAGVENGKVAVKQDSVVVREGEQISQKAAEVLLRFGIMPMEIGLDLVATYENGVIYNKDILDIDEDVFMGKLQDAARWAMNLSVEAAFPTKDNINILIGKAFNDSKALGISQNIFDSVIIDALLGKAERQMLTVAKAGNFEVAVHERKEDAPAAHKAEEKHEAPKAEAEKSPSGEKKHEPKKEEHAAPKHEVKHEQKKPEPKLEEKKEEIKKMAMPAYPQEQKDYVNDAKKKEIEEVERLARKLQKKGTLR